MSGPSEKSIPSPEGTATILAVSPLPADRVRLREIDGNWEDLLKATARLPDPPNLIVFSRLADESLWARVLNLGGFDVLMTPFEPEEVLRVTFSAWSRWECDFGASTAKEATRTGRPAAIKAGPPEEDWAERVIRTRSSAAEPDGLHKPGVRTWLQQGSS